MYIFTATEVLYLENFLALNLELISIHGNKRYFLVHMHIVKLEINIRSMKYKNSQPRS